MLHGDYPSDDKRTEWVENVSYSLNIIFTQQFLQNPLLIATVKIQFSVRVGDLFFSVRIVLGPFAVGIGLSRLSSGTNFRYWVTSRRSLETRRVKEGLVGKSEITSPTHGVRLIKTLQVVSVGIRGFVSRSKGSLTSP